MECKIYIENEIIGNVNFEIIDASMGAISGELIVNRQHKVDWFKSKLRECFQNP